MSGGITAATVISAVAAVGTAASAAYSIYSAVSAKAPSLSLGGLIPGSSEITGASQNALSARTQLLETVGGSAGQTLNPGQTSNNKNTIFGN